MRFKIFLLPAVLLSIFAVALTLDTNPELDAYRLNSPEATFITDLRKVDVYPLYVANYTGDYRLPDYLASGIRPDLSSVSCTCFYTGASGLFGRNFDFPANPALLLYTQPSDDYRSVSMVDLGYFGFSMEHLPEKSSINDFLEAPYMPFDGMNEKGLIVGMAAVPYGEGTEDPDLVDIGEIAAIRLMLDYAADVEEALELLRGYNVMMLEPPVHYLIADASGDSVIVEFIGGEMHVINGESYQLVTNFIVTGSNAPYASGCMRYDAVYRGLVASDGFIDSVEAMNLLHASSQDSTIWSTVYDQARGEVNVAMGRDYLNVHTFTLKMTSEP